MQNQANTKYSSNPKDIYKFTKFFLEKLNPKEDYSKTTISKVLSKFPHGKKTSSQHYNFCKNVISLKVHDM